MCGCLSCAPALGTWPTTQACALTEIELALNPLSYTSQGSKVVILVPFLWLWGFFFRGEGVNIQPMLFSILLNACT